MPIETVNVALLCLPWWRLFAFRSGWASVRSDEIARRAFIDHSDIVQYSVTLTHTWLCAHACSGSYRCLSRLI